MMNQVNISRFFGFLMIMALYIPTYGQDDTGLPYRIIPEYPGTFDEHTVAARMVDGLGFRYYWATEGLQPEDLSYKPSADARTSMETLAHIHGLCNVLLNAVMQKPNTRAEEKEWSFEDLRKETLLAIKGASDRLKAAAPGDMENFSIVFRRGEQTSEFPFWNMLNGPLADALWHVGQVVSMRRGSGNPISPKVSVFSGTVRE
jgi:hypothetical protein